MCLDNDCIYTSVAYTVTRVDNHVALDLQRRFW